MKSVLTFRVETSCTFEGHFYKATDDCIGDDLAHWQFPASMLYDLPQHFSAVEEDLTTRDDEAQDKRDAYFAVVLPINANPEFSEKHRHAETARIKANFQEYGASEAPDVPKGPKAPEDMTKAEIVEALTALKVEFDPALKKADLVPLLVKAREDAE